MVFVIMFVFVATLDFDYLVYLMQEGIVIVYNVNPFNLKIPSIEPIC